MARAIPTMEQFLVGAYLRLIEQCDAVTYDSAALGRKLFWTDVVARNEAKQCIFNVDFPGKFDSFEANMRPDTMVRKLVERYVQMHKHGLALEYEPERVFCQVWTPRPPARRVAEALAKATPRLEAEHGIRLALVDQAEVRRRVAAVAERARNLSFDYDNLFIRALLLAQGRLDYRAGSPLEEVHLKAMYRFPRSLASAEQIPSFIYQFLTSGEIVHWLNFNSSTFDDMNVWVAEMGPAPGLGELRDALPMSGEPAYDDPGYLDDDDEGVPYVQRRYTAREAAELTRLCLANVAAVREAGDEQALHTPFNIEIEFMVPYLWRAQEQVDASQIEREILRYGGKRDQMLAHFADGYPSKAPYRAILRVEFLRPNGEEPRGYTGHHTMRVPINDPTLTPDLRAAVTINYRPDFAGYFVLLMDRLATNLDF